MSPGTNHEEMEELFLCGAEEVRECGVSRQFILPFSGSRCRFKCASRFLMLLPKVSCEDADTKFEILRITVESVNIMSSGKSEEGFAAFEIQVPHYPRGGGGLWSHLRGALWRASPLTPALSGRC